MEHSGRYLQSYSPLAQEKPTRKLAIPLKTTEVLPSNYKGKDKKLSTAVPQHYQTPTTTNPKGETPPNQPGENSYRKHTEQHLLSLASTTARERIKSTIQQHTKNNVLQKYPKSSSVYLPECNMQISEVTMAQMKKETWPRHHSLSSLIKGFPHK